MAVFSAEMSEINIVHNVLKAVPTNDYAIVRPMEEGLKIVIENSKSSEIAIYLPSELFSHYHIDNEADVMFKIQLKRFIDCLHIFGDEGNPSMKLSYRQEGAPFILIIKHSEENIIVDCEFATMTVDDYQEVYLLEECNENTIVFNGDGLIDVLSDIDISSDDYEVTISNNLPNFQLTTNSILGQSTINIPKESKVVAIFNCKEEFQARYDFSTLRNIMKVIMLASKISLSTGKTGLMGLNMIIQHEEHRVHIEYFFTAQFSDDDTM
ncbi:uncharacterized protein Rad1 [Atheta coriaria]|uniref:uncharacterized protein Rad1 n=1 Tax=Dalotia coriaria TaxID=877792 RepID=UPI0031F37DDC